MSSTSLQHIEPGPNCTPIENVESNNMDSQRLSKDELTSHTKFGFSLNCGKVSIRKENNKLIRCVRVSPRNSDGEKNLDWTSCSENTTKRRARHSGCCGNEIAMLRKVVIVLFFTSVLTLLLVLLMITGRVKTTSMSCSCETDKNNEDKGKFLLLIFYSDLETLNFFCISLQSFFSLSDKIFDITISSQNYNSDTVVAFYVKIEMHS